ncbi:hypothetical protein WA538_002285 [Blastocystis sp. DL]
MMAVTETPTEDTQAVHNKTTIRRFVLDYLLVHSSSCVSVNEIADALHEQVNEVRDILDVYECLGLVDRPGADIYSVSSELLQSLPSMKDRYLNKQCFQIAFSEVTHNCMQLQSILLQDKLENARFIEEHKGEIVISLKDVYSLPLFESQVVIAINAPSDAVISSKSDSESNFVEISSQKGAVNAKLLMRENTRVSTYQTCHSSPFGDTSVSDSTEAPTKPSFDALPVDLSYQGSMTDLFL